MSLYESIEGLSIPSDDALEGSLVNFLIGYRIGNLDDQQQELIPLLGAIFEFANEEIGRNALIIAVIEFLS